MSRKYWSQRHARDSELPLAVASRLFASVVQSLQQRGYFTEWFGFHCVDLDFVSGLAGADAAAYAMRKTYRDDVWPVSINHSGWDEDAFLTAVEFAYDHVSKPVGGSYHSWNQCGDHWDKFDRDAGREEYRNEVNDLLRDYGFGFELRSDGHVVRLAPSGLEPLLEAQPPMLRGVAYEGRVAAAVSKFRRRESSAEDRLDAVRDLAAVLELLRPQLKSVLSGKDDDVIFDLANNFGIRHLNNRQRLAYDQDIWLSWMFYFFLATTHAATRLLARQQI